jgi:hypothetical protein
MNLVLDFNIIRWIFSYYFLVYIDFPCDYLFESISCNMFSITQQFGFRLDSLSDSVKICRCFAALLILCRSDMSVYGCSMQ